MAEMLGKSSITEDARALSVFLGDLPLDSSRIAAPLYEHRHGGGALSWAWSADRPGLTAYTGPIQCTAVGVGFVDFKATANGGPYVDLDGSEALYIPDASASFAEPGASTFIAWAWVNARAFPAAPMFALAKQNAGPGNRQWALFWNNVSGAFEWQVSSDGTALVTATSTYTELAATWYMIVGEFAPSSVVRIGVGAATDSTLTFTDTGGSPPASIYTGGTATFNIGAYNGGASGFWDGYIGINTGRITIAAANLNDFANLLFAETRYKYR